jgi:hypothetical protein
MGISFVGATNHIYTIIPTTVNNGGGYSSSSNYSSQYSIGQLASGSLSGISYQVNLDPLSITDGDGDGVLDNRDNCIMVSNANQLNTDSDPLGNACDLDDDNDGLDDTVEIGLGTDPLLADTDGDGLDDGVDPNPLTANADGDLAPYGAPDGIINAADLFIARQIILGTIVPTAQDIIHADIYPLGMPDGVIDMSDLVILEQMILSPNP